MGRRTLACSRTPGRGARLLSGGPCRRRCMGAPSCGGPRRRRGGGGGGVDVAACAQSMHVTCAQPPTSRAPDFPPPPPPPPLRVAVKRAPAAPAGPASLVRAPGEDAPLAAAELGASAPRRSAATHSAALPGQGESARAVHDGRLGAGLKGLRIACGRGTTGACCDGTPFPPSRPGAAPAKRAPEPATSMTCVSEEPNPSPIRRAESASWPRRSRSIAHFVFPAATCAPNASSQSKAHFRRPEGAMGALAATQRVVMRRGSCQFTRMPEMVDDKRSRLLQYDILGSPIAMGGCGLILGPRGIAVLGAALAQLPQPTARDS
jgi:hypothetical protein